MLGTLRFAAEMKRLRSCFKSRLGNGRRGVEGKLFSGDGRQSDGGREGSGAGGRKTSAKVHFLFVRSERCNRTSPHRRSSIDRSSTERVQPALPQSPTRQRSPQPPVPFLLHPQVLLPPPPPPSPLSPRKDVGGRWDFECCTHRLFISCRVCSARWRSTSSGGGAGSPLLLHADLPCTTGWPRPPAGACRFRVWLCL